jgi:hypothetical protein
MLLGLFRIITFPISTYVSLISKEVCKRLLGRVVRFSLEGASDGLGITAM